MRKSHLLKIIFICVITSLSSLVTAVNVTFSVTVPAGTQQVFIIGSSAALGSWQANEGGAILMEQTGPVTWQKTLSLNANTQYSYMFLCGPGWVYEQSPNVSTTFTTGTSDVQRNNIVTAWNSIPPVYSKITFNVSVPVETNNVFLIGSDELGNWDADKGYSLKMLKTEEGKFTLTVDLSPGKNYEYKYLSGAAMNYQQDHVAAFNLNTANTNEVHDVVLLWKAQPAPQPDIQYCLKRDGNRIANSQGNNFLIRSIGLGNYMVWEPYMWKVTNYGLAGIMTEIVQRMSLLLRPDDLQFFIDQYMANYITKADVDSLKTWGFNAIRLPMHYNLFINSDPANNSFIEKGFAMTEELRQWCAANEMYLILDLHAAPGGQGNDRAIADSYGPALWDGDENGTAEQYQNKVVILWRELARRFAGKDWMGGYDLLNETNYGGNHLKLLELFKRCVNQIRLYDKNNIIYLEGNWFANDFSTIAPNLWGTQWDENMAYSPHKYWASHVGFSGEDLRNNFNVPLFLGETGENSNEWFYQNVKLAESKNIGWAWWAYKKIDNISGFTSIHSSESFKKITQFINNGTGMDPNAKDANFEVFLDFLEYVKLENCKINYDVLFSLIDQQQDGALTKPFGKNLIPGVVHATNYDLGRQGYAYYENNPDQVLERINGLNDPKAYNAGWTGRNDAVDIELTSGVPDPKSNGYNIGWTNAGEWVQYSVFTENEGVYKIKIRSASTQDVTISLRNKENQVLVSKLINSTGNWQNWVVSEIGNLELQKGWNQVRLFFNNGAINVNYLEFDFVTSVGKTADSKSEVSFFINGDSLNLKSGVMIVESSIYDLKGRVMVKSGSTGIINVATLSQGVYLIETLLANGEKRNLKFIR